MLHLIFVKICLPKCLDLSFSSSRHLLLFILLHHPLMLLSIGRLVQLISPPVDSLLWPHSELHLIAAGLSGETDAQKLQLFARLQPFFICTFTIVKFYGCFHCNSTMICSDALTRSKVVFCCGKLC